MPTQTVRTHPVPATERRARSLFLRVTDTEGRFPGGRSVDALFGELNRIGADAGDLDALQREAAGWSAKETARYRKLLDRSADAGTRGVLARRAALACAPLALHSGAWLQWMSAPGNADDPVVLRILTLYASDVGVGRPRASRGSAYLALLRDMQLSDYASPASRLAHDQRIADRDFYLPSMLLAMSRRPDDFRPEVLGADLCLRSIGLLPALAVVRTVSPTTADWTAIDPATSREEGRPTGLELNRAAVAGLLDEAPDGEARRVALGFGWALAAVRRWSEDLHAELDDSRDPAYEMVQLLRLRAREGAVYHQGFKVQGRSLSDWLQDARTDPTGLLEALAASKLVKPGRAERSPLVNGLVGERGPMFRVFAPEDLTVIRRWIDSLAAKPDPGGKAGPPPAAGSAYEVPPVFTAALDAGGAEDDAEPSSLREAYHLLQRRTDTPAVRRFALDYVRGWLARSRHGMDKDGPGLPGAWSPEGLRPWLVEQHDRHGRDFESGADVPLPSREEMIDSTVQLAPLTLIDGAWLQGFTDYEHVSSEQGHFLFETYWDELGNGVPRLNHPRIYREVLAEMGVSVPPTASREFAMWPGFRDAAFELPVYWLCIGRFPRTFMPEVLGLNLAMELSGVGGSYRRARLALKKYGFSTMFVDIHNTIDNVATGHSAWAADAIDTFLASVPVSQGADVQRETWERVRVGYRSLNPPSGFWARQAFRRARNSGGSK